jgi:CIC family chloride channel protein
LGLACVSSAAGTPGGLFAPLLVPGAHLGLLFGLFCRLTFPALGVQTVAFAVVGLAAFFTSVVRALVMEMTASFPMFTAMLVPTLLGDLPVYDSLRDR